MSSVSPRQSSDWALATRPALSRASDVPLLVQVNAPRSFPLEAGPKPRLPARLVAENWLLPLLTCRLPPASTSSVPPVTVPANVVRPLEAATRSVPALLIAPPRVCPAAVGCSVSVAPPKMFAYGKDAEPVSVPAPITLSVLVPIVDAASSVMWPPCRFHAA